MRLVVPARGGVPSGGDVYDARLAAAWSHDHGRVDVVALPGPWPRPSPADRAALARALELPGPGLVMVDGLVGSACPDEVVRAVARGTRVVLLVHLPLPAETGLPAAEARALAESEARAVTAASDVVVTSEWAARDLARRYGRRDVVVAVPGAEPAPLAAGSSPPHLLVLAALTAVKNHAVLVPALAALCDLPWRATFAGSTTAQPRVADRLARAIGDAGLQDRIALPGAVTGAYLNALWHRTDLLLVPSLVETYGLVITEALARGVPALVSEGTGAVEALTRSIRARDTGAGGSPAGPAESLPGPGTGGSSADPAETLSDPSTPGGAGSPAGPAETPPDPGARDGLGAGRSAPATGATGRAVGGTPAAPATGGTRSPATDSASREAAVAGASVGDPTEPRAWEVALRHWLTTPEQRAAWRAAASSRRQRLRTWADTAADLRRGLLLDR